MYLNCIVTSETTPIKNRSKGNSQTPLVVRVDNEQVVQRGCGITSFGDFQNLSKHGSWQPDLTRHKVLSSL